MSEVGLKILATIPFKMMKIVLMAMGEVDIGLIPAPLPTIIQVSLIYRWDFIFMVMMEVEIGLRPANVLHITISDYTFPTQGYLKNIYQGVCKDKTHIKIILIILIQSC